MVDTTTKEEKTEEENKVKTIPSKGTRIKGALLLSVFSVVAWIVSILILKMDWLTLKDGEYMLWGASMMKWGVSTAFFLYAGSETTIKVAEAYMNKKPNR